METAPREIIKSQIDFTVTSAGEMKIDLSGKLNADTIAALWHELSVLQRKYKPKVLSVDVAGVTYCDSIGAILILEMEQWQLAGSNKFVLQNSSAELQKLLQYTHERTEALNLSQTQQQATTPPLTVKKPSFVTRLGYAIVARLSEVKNNLIFIGALFAALLNFVLRPRSIRWQDFWRAMDDIGPRALSIVFLIGFLVGVIITFQSAEPFGRFGTQIYIIDLVGLGLVREMGPLMTAILLAGRTASAFSAEIGSMKINRELDALTTMGLEPVKFLILPRILAATIVTPLLSMFLIISGLIGCFLVMKSLGYNFLIFSNELYGSITLTDFFAGLVKTFVFGAVIGSTGCMHGIKTNIGASAVGISTTKAVVSSLILLVFVDGIFAVVYYTLGI